MKQTRFSVSRTVSASSNSRRKAVVMRLGSVKYRILPHARLDDDPPVGHHLCLLGLVCKGERTVSYSAVLRVGTASFDIPNRLRLLWRDGQRLECGHETSLLDISSTMLKQGVFNAIYPRQKTSRPRVTISLTTTLALQMFVRSLTDKDHEIDIMLHLLS